MARRHRKQNQANRIPWPIVLAVGGVLLVVAAFFLANRGGDGGGTPKVAVDPQKIDYGHVSFGTNETFTIKVTNTGDGVLRFKDQPYIEVLEGC
ncbi:MAG: hypothetical protein ACM3MF_09265 [Anaerolineae bacterium]